MGRYREPSLTGPTKAAKDRRRALFRLVYRFLEPGEEVVASDEENIGRRWRRVRPRYVGQPVGAGCRGQFRRRQKPFIPLDNDDSDRYNGGIQKNATQNEELKMTPYQDNVVRSIHADARRRKAEYVKRFGDKFVDVILMSYHRHGRNKVGFTTDFGGRSTARSGETLAGFAKHVFGTGTLKLIERDDVGEKWAVLRK